MVQAFAPVLGCLDDIPFFTKSLGNEISGVCIIFDDQQATAHDPNSFLLEVKHSFRAKHMVLLNNLPGAKLRTRQSRRFADNSNPPGRRPPYFPITWRALVSDQAISTATKI